MKINKFNESFDNTEADLLKFRTFIIRCIK